ncbi:MAG: hypothetical protein ABJO88_06810 [Parasphingorhabdus sp.]
MQIYLDCGFDASIRKLQAMTDAAFSASYPSLGRGNKSISQQTSLELSVRSENRIGA